MGLIKMVALQNETPDAETPIISPDGTGRSVLFAGSGEELEDALTSCTHFRDKYTIAYWAMSTVGGVGRSFFLGIAGAVTVLQQTMAGGANTRRLVLRNPDSAVNIKVYDYAATSDVWHHVVIVVDVSANNPTSEQVIIYVDGAKVSPTKTTDDMLTGYGGVNITAFTNVGSALAGNIHSIAVWNKALSAAEIPVIYNSGIGNLDLSKKKGSYKSHKQLQHWFFFDTTVFGNLGRDYGKAARTESINLLDDDLGLDDTNLVIDAPGY